MHVIWVLGLRGCCRLLHSSCQHTGRPSHTHVHHDALHARALEQDTPGYGDDLDLEKTIKHLTSYVVDQNQKVRCLQASAAGPWDCRVLLTL